MIYTSECNEVCNNAFIFWHSINQNLKEQWMYSHRSLEGVTLSTLINWEITSIELYKISLSKSIPLSKRALSIFHSIIDKGIRFNPYVLLNKLTSKNDVNLAVCETNVKQVILQTDKNIMYTNKNNLWIWEKCVQKELWDKPFCLDCEVLPNKVRSRKFEVTSNLEIIIENIRSQLFWPLWIFSVKYQQNTIVMKKLHAK